MDFYDVLKVPPKADQAEMDRAYQKLVRDARYDNSINQKDIEVAYRTLSDPTQRALYDATLAERGKRLAASEKIKRPVVFVPGHRKKQLLWIAGVMALLVVVYYPLRFNYVFQSFVAGDTLYYKDNNSFFGTVTKCESNHSFGTQSANACLVKTEFDTEVWFPMDDLKVLCVKKK